MTGPSRPQASAARPAHWWCAGLAVLLGLTGAPVRAGLVEASSPHFTIYADAPPSQLHDLAQRLERFRQALDRQPGMAPPPDGEARLTIYVASSQNEVRQLFGASPGAGRVEGFYLARSDGPLAIVAPAALRRKDGYRLALHEYVHHAMAARGQGGVPGWVSEGAAQYYAAASFAPDGSVVIGVGQGSRRAELRRLKPLTAAAIVADPDQRQGLIANRGLNAFYGMSWLLFRQFSRAPGRSGQLTTYLAALRGGTSPTEAAHTAFGDLALLDGELAAAAVDDAGLPPLPTEEAAIAVRPLPWDERLILPAVLRARAGLPPDARQLMSSRRIARHGAGGSLALAQLAMLEALAGRDRAALALADRVLALAPGQTDAVRVRAQALLRLDDPAATAALDDWQRSEPASAAALAARFRLSRQTGQGMDAAAAGLARALRLAPWDVVLRLDLADWQSGSGDPLAARATLMPLAESEAGGAAAALARQRLAALPVAIPADVPDKATAAAPMGHTAVQ